MAQGIILAAGYSSRAKSNKMFFVYNEKPLIQHVIDGMKPFVSHIFVVTGHYNDEIRDYLNDNSCITCITNKEYDLGMFSSIQQGVLATSESFFVIPGDCPFVKGKTYQALLNGEKDIRVPCYLGKKGHPIFISKHLKSALLMEPNDSNLKDFRNRYDYEIIPVDDVNILTDVDTVNDFNNLNYKIRKE